MLDTFKKLPPERQAAILDAAATVIAKKGYYNATVADICKKVRISNGALYKYFKNKESLFRTILDRGVDLMVTELYSKYVDPSDRLLDSIKNLLTGIIQFTQDYHQYVSLYVEIGSCSMNPIAEYISERIEREGRIFFTGLVDDAKKRGEIDPNVKSDLLAYSIDNFFTLFAYALVSEHHKRRFDGFFRTNGSLTTDDMVNVVLRSVEMLIR